MSLAIRGLTKAFGGELALDGVDLEVAEGEIHALLGPERLGQVHADRLPERPAGARPAARWRSAISTVGRFDPAQRVRGRHGGHLPALLADPAAERRRQHLPRVGAHGARRPHRPRARRSPRRRELLARLGARVDPRAPVAVAERRAEAARRDRQGDAPPPEAAGPRRADRRAGRGRGAAARSAAAQAARLGARDPLRHPPAERGVRDRRSRHRPARRPQRAERADRRAVASRRDPGDRAAARRRRAPSATGASRGRRRPRAGARPAFAAPGVGPIDLSVAAGEVVARLRPAGLGPQRAAGGALRHPRARRRATSRCTAARSAAPRRSRSLRRGLALVPAERGPPEHLRVDVRARQRAACRTSASSARPWWRSRGRRAQSVRRDGGAAAPEPRRTRGAQAWTYSGGNQQKLVVGRWLTRAQQRARPAARRADAGHRRRRARGPVRARAAIRRADPAAACCSPPPTPRRSRRSPTVRSSSRAGESWPSCKARRSRRSASWTWRTARPTSPLTETRMTTDTTPDDLEHARPAPHAGRLQRIRSRAAANALLLGVVALLLDLLAAQRRVPHRRQLPATSSSRRRSSRSSPCRWRC